MGSSTSNDVLKAASPLCASSCPGSQVISERSTGDLQNREYSEALLDATNDAVRHIDLTNNRLTWPQGLHELLGYASTSATNSTSFWSEHVHPEDYSRVTTDINQAISRGDHRWTG